MMIKRGMSLLLSSAAAVALTGAFIGTANAGASNCCDQVEELQRQNMLLQEQLDKKPAAAEEEKGGLQIPGDLSFNAAVTTDYYFRGLSQTDHGPAVQAGLDWSMPITDVVSFNIGSWASNVNFADGGLSDVGGVLELDVYGGLSFAVNDNFSIDLSGIGYLYPNANDKPATDGFEYFEIALGGNYDFGYFSSTLSVNYSPDYFGGSGEYFYPALSVSVPILDWASIDGNVGYNFINDNNLFGTDDYLDYGIAGSVTLENTITLSVGYYGTDLDTAGCYGGSDFCDGRVIGTVSAAL